MIAGGVGAIVLVWWFFGPSATTDTPKSKEEITQLLEAQGYQVKEVDVEDNTYEAEVYQQGKKFEIKLDITGKILKIEQDD